MDEQPMEREARSKYTNILYEHIDRVARITLNRPERLNALSHGQGSMHEELGSAFAEADVVGACDKVENPQAPVWSKVHLTNAAALGCGTIAYDEDAGEIRPHVHISLGLKEHSANGYTSHLLAAQVQFLVEMILVEITAPAMSRPPDPSLYDVPRLTFTHAQPAGGPG